jgi:hypothetical protein
MANLLEALQPKMEDTTSQLSTLLRAKSGKALAGPATALSTQQEQAALAQTAQQMQPVQAAAQTQAMAQEQQAREVEQRAGQQQTEIAQAREANKMQTQLRTDQLLQDLEQGRGKIDLGKYQSNLEQIGFNLRLDNKEYVDNLQREGDRARLTNKLQFDEQLARSILSDNKQLLEKQLGNKSILAANDREFARRMADMGIQNAWQMINNEIKSAKEIGQAQAVGGLITAGIAGYGKGLEYEEASTKVSQNLARSERANPQSDVNRMRSWKE